LASNTDYSSWEKEDLIKKIHSLEKRKKYGLVWDTEREPERVVLDCQTQLPILKEIKENEIQTGKDDITHILIEGDNYHSLSVLNYTHEKSVDLIYIDPPFNTGSSDFKYNDKFVGDEDSYRHSKWLSFMNHRLKLAKNVLKNSGVILVHIDDNEFAQLKLLMDDAFGPANFRNAIVWAYRTGGAPRKNDVFSSKHDYILFYSKDSNSFYFNKLKERIIYKKNFFGPKKDADGQYYADVNLRDVIEGELTLLKDGDLYKEVNVKPVINLSSERIPDFPTQKPKGLIRFLLEVLAPPNAVVLDFFAGSGSTAYSILELNNEYDKDYQFILCTNDENGICSNICYPRLKKLMKGNKEAKTKVQSLGGNLKYYRTAFVPAAPTDKNKELLTKQSIEMLVLKEGTFEKVTDNPSYVIYRNSDKYTGIIFDQLSFAEFKRAILEVDKPISLYIFSLADEDFSDDFADTKGLIKICAIPEAILRVYRRIFR